MLTVALCATVLGSALAGGFVRGMSGFGGSLVMMPLLAIVANPKYAVGPVLLLEAFAAAPLLRGALRLVQWRVIVPICAAAFVAVPFGAYALLHADPQWLRRAIALLVAGFALILLSGLRYRGSQTLPASLAMGLVCGVLLGGTGIGGPPVIVYLLSGPTPGAVTRANLTLTIVAISVVALVVLWARGALLVDGPLPQWLLAPGYVAGLGLGAMMFGRIDERRFRQITLGILVAVSIVALLA
jgi:uncharacterized membrane protein YfcA